jgi:hypothetical protein
MTDTAQSRSEPQRLRALEQANAIRLARAGLKRRIALGEVSAAEVILGCPDAANRWTVAELLMSQRRWGETRCRKFLERNGISEIKAIGALTVRQRQLLASQLQAAHPVATFPAAAPVDQITTTEVDMTQVTRVLPDPTEDSMPRFRELALA